MLTVAPELTPSTAARVLGCLILTALFAAGLAASADSDESGFRSPVARLQAPRSETEMTAIFKSRSYDLSSVRQSGTCPRLFVQDIPLDMAGVEPVQAKKDLFISLLLPLVLKANETIAEQRETLLQLREHKAKGGEVTADEQSWLQSLADHYSAKPGDLDELVLRVDIVPPALGLAQGIDESGWGTSRFAREGESLFGQHTSADSHAKIRATSASSVGVAAFSGMLGSVQSYIFPETRTHCAVATTAFQPDHTETSASSRASASTESSSPLTRKASSVPTKSDRVVTMPLIPT